MWGNLPVRFLDVTLLDVDTKRHVTSHRSNVGEFACHAVDVEKSGRRFGDVRWTSVGAVALRPTDFQRISPTDIAKKIAKKNLGEKFSFARSKRKHLKAIQRIYDVA